MFQGSATDPWPVNYIEPAFIGTYPLYTVQSQCISNSIFPVLINQSSITRELGIHSPVDFLKNIYLNICAYIWNS